MNLTDQEIATLTLDWVEARMPNEEQRANTSRIIRRAQLVELKKTFSTHAQHASHEKIDEMISEIERDIQNLAPNLHDVAVKRTYEEFEVMLNALKGDMGPLSDEQQKRITANLDAVARYRKDL